MKSRSLRSIGSLAILLTALSLSLSACEHATTPTTTPPVAVPAKAVFVLNEGSFGKSNASLDLYIPAKDSIIHDALPGLGDVGNDIELMNGKLYIVLNGTGKIFAVRPDTIRKIDSVEFTNFEAPNAIVQVAPTKAVVTQLYSPNAVILDLQTDKVVGSIALGAGSVGAAVLANRLFISSGSDSLNVCDVATLGVSKVIKVGDVPQTVLADSANNQIAVLCWGDYGVTLSSVYFVNATTLAVTDSLVLPSAVTGGNLIAAGAMLYAIGGDSVVSISLSTHKIVNAAFITSSTGYYDGGYDAVTNELYLGQTSYSSNGSVDIFDQASGQKKRSFIAGIAPAHFAFYR